MSSPQPVHVGEILRGLRAADHNAFYETWRKVNQLVPNNTKGAPSIAPNRLVVSVFNEGAAIGTEFPVLKLTAPLFTPTDRANVIWEPIAFKGDTPDADTTIADIAIIQGPIGTDVMGRGHGVISGYTYCTVEVSDAAHTHAKPTDGENTKLASGSTGAPILWKESGTGTKKAVIKLGGVANNTIRKARVITTISGATSATAWGSGTIQLKVEATGEPDGNTIDVENEWSKDFIADSQVSVNTAYDPPRVEGGTCEAEDPVTYWGD